MAPSSRPPQAGRGPVGKSRSANDRQEESVYNIGESFPAPAAPRVRTYNVAPVSPTGAAAPAPQRNRMHADSSQISSIINPVHGVRDAQVRQGQKPFDHARANALAVKEQSQLNALRKQASNELEQLQGGPPSALPRSASLPMRRASPTPGQHPPSYPGGGGGGAPGQPSTSGRNFVAENKLGAGAPTRIARPGSQEDDGLKYLSKADYGRVPTYLLQRKIEMAEAAAEAERAKELALVPPGMRLLPEEERLETLAILARNKGDVERALQSLPIVIETPSAIRRKNELEQRLREIEEATKVFSRAKVLVHL